MKRVFALLIVLVMCISLCACSGQGTSSPSQSKDETITVSTTIPDETITVSANIPDTAITVHAQIPADWADPGCWVWSAPDAKDAFEEWPGKAMTKNGNWYVAEAPGWINYVVINGNGGSVQTTDLPVVAGKDIWIVVDQNGNAQVFYEESASMEYHESMSAVLDQDVDAPITANKAVTYWTETVNYHDPEPDSGTYTTDYISEELVAQSPEEARYIVKCVCNKIYAGHYEHGGMGYRTQLRCTIWQRKPPNRSLAYVAEECFDGGNPPEVINDTKDHCGDLPDADQIKQWITQNIQSENEERKADALASAKSKVTGVWISYSRLIERLMDDGFTYEEAVYAADNCGADWFEEAVELAVSYLEDDLITKVDGWKNDPKGTLIRLLEKNGFTHEEAVYGAGNSGL